MNWADRADGQNNLKRTTKRKQGSEQSSARHRRRYMLYMGPTFSFGAMEEALSDMKQRDETQAEQVETKETRTSTASDDESSFYAAHFLSRRRGLNIYDIIRAEANRKVESNEAKEKKQFAEEAEENLKKAQKERIEKLRALDAEQERLLHKRRELCQQFEEEIRLEFKHLRLIEMAQKLDDQCALGEHSSLRDFQKFCKKTLRRFHPDKTRTEPLAAQAKKEELTKILIEMSRRSDFHPMDRFDRVFPH